MSTVILFKDIAALSKSGVAAEVIDFFNTKFSNDTDLNSALYQGSAGLFFAEKSGAKEGNAELERLRKTGTSLCKKANDEKLEALEILNLDAPAEHALALAEGVILSNYQFIKYLKDADKKTNKLTEISIAGAGSDDLNNLKIIADAVYLTRSLVNEPVLSLNAIGLANAFENMGKEAGFSVEVWNEAQLESQKMGGLLSVNKGSQDPATFSIMEYKGENAKNTQPIVLVGKGVVFDTGGLSLKPTPNSMDHMKCDMAGSAVVAGVMYAVAKLKLPLHIVGLVPATDNRPGENAICPGDIITTYNGTTVEVLNTDAEGRLILCDALAFAQKYNPELVLDFATLTGAAAAAIGPYGSVMIGTANEEVKNAIKSSGDKVYERLAELPLWSEYEDEMKGDISDLKNLGKGGGGAQTAAAFLKYFTNYPWLHFDIAGTAFSSSADAYRPKGGTGVGVRLIVDFLIQKANGK